MPTERKRFVYEVHYREYDHEAISVKFILAQSFEEAKAMAESVIGDRMTFVKIERILTVSEIE